MRLWPLCAPVNRSQCARGRQKTELEISTPPHLRSDGDQSAARSSRDQLRTPLTTRIWRRRLRLTFAIRIRMPIFNRWRIRRADSADLSACAWSWWRGARELPARAGARGPARPPRIVVHALPRQIGGPAGRARVDPGARPAGRGGLQSPLRSGSRPTDWPTEYSSEFLRAGRVEPCRARLTTTNPNRSVRGASRRQCSL